jgi:hypothetical protein
MPSSTDFDVVRQVLGRGAANTRSIFERSGAKVRLRGESSRRADARSRNETGVPLQLVISSAWHDINGFRRAVQMAVQLMRHVERLYLEHVGEGKCEGGGAAGQHFSCYVPCSCDYFLVLDLVRRSSQGAPATHRRQR